MREEDVYVGILPNFIIYPNGAEIPCISFVGLIE